MVPNQVVRNFIKRYERKNVSISKAFYMYLTSVYGRQSQLG